jgi:N-acyl homoserine lactone hydrolase
LNLPHLRYELLNGESTLFDGLEILLTPGHAPAHQSVLLRLPETGPVIICGDAVYCQENFDHDSWSSQADPETARTSAFKLRETAQREGARLFYGHDRNQARDIRYAPHSYR